MENTKRKLTEHLAKEDHLHIRGEYNMFQSYADEILGSPPHTWRIPHDSEPSFKPVKDHLHIRGEYEAQIKSAKDHGGSPPHTWRILILAYQ